MTVEWVARLVDDGRVVGVLLAVVLSVLLWPSSARARTVVGSSVRHQPAQPPAWVGAARQLLRRDLRLRREGPHWVADFAELSAVGLEAGLPAVEAARLAAEVETGRRSPGPGDLADRLGRAERSGLGVGEVLGDAARRDSDLTFLARAWRLTEEFGVPAAPAARVSAQVLRERAARDQRRVVLTAGPRASMWLLTLLPLTGPGVTLVLGLPVGAVYGDTVALMATLAGVGLTALGWWWARTLLRRAMRATEVG